MADLNWAKYRCDPYLNLSLAIAVALAALTTLFILSVETSIVLGAIALSMACGMMKAMVGDALSRRSKLPAMPAQDSTEPDTIESIAGFTRLYSAEDKATGARPGAQESFMVLAGKLRWTFRSQRACGSGLPIRLPKPIKLYVGKQIKATGLPLEQVGLFLGFRQVDRVRRRNSTRSRWWQWRQSGCTVARSGFRSESTVANCRLANGI